MRDLPVELATAGFFVVGAGAIAKPRLVTAQSGILHLTAARRNEVRAVVCQVRATWPLRDPIQGRDRQARSKTKRKTNHRKLIP
jgi:hypothetical protein